MSERDTTNTNVERIALRPREAAAAIGLSPRKVAELMASKDSGFPIVRVGRARLVPTDALREWLAGQIGGGA